MPESRPTKSDPFNHKVESAKWTFVDGDDPDALAEFAGRMAAHINTYWTSPWHDRAQAFLDFADGILEPDPPGQYGATEPRRLLNELRGWLLTWKATQDPAHIFEAGRAFEALRIYLTSDYLTDGRNRRRAIEAVKKERHDPILEAAKKVLETCPDARHKKSGKPNAKGITDVLADKPQDYFGTDDPPLDYERMLRNVIRPAIKDGTLR